MKAQELRIGNLIRYKKVIYSVLSLRIYLIDEWRISILTEDKKYSMIIKDWNLIEPIPLTEEWLLKGGIKENCIFPDNEHYLITKYQSRQNTFGLFFEGEFTGVYIEYVHTFQNLYFALTTQEFKIK